MEVVSTIAALRSRLSGERRNGHSVAFVPTMGNLHEGHMALARQARGEAQVLVASLFVNRLQFGPSEDFDRYPRTFAVDCEKLQACGTDVVFAPDEAELYPEPQEFLVQPPAIANQLEGTFRPGFFTGVATVVLKLFNVVQPDTAVFGKKDYQQLAIVRAMVQQLALPIRILAGETVRAADGLALSSRNGYLSVAERARASLLHRTLSEVSEGLRAGRPREQLESAAAMKLEKEQWQVDYVAVRKAADLQFPPASVSTVADGKLVVLGAARLGSTRLMDNLEISL